MKNIVSQIMIVLLLVGMSAFALNIRPVKAAPSTIIVPDNYPTIQGAINNANDGDTIFVRNGTYSEVVTVNKPVSLVGEDPNSTIINGTVLIESSNVEIARLCIEGGQGISVGNVKGCVINNTISRGSHSFGVSLLNASDSQISFCEMYSNFYDGICLDHVSNNNTISYNDIHDANRDGIGIHQSTLNTVEANRIVSVGIGLHLRYSNGNTAKKNNVTGCYTGIWMEHSTLNRLHHNSFAGNTISTSVPDSANNIWDDGYPSGGNYWSDHTSADVYYGQYQNETGSDGIGDVPYIIDGNNRDNYPLMRPYVPFENQTIYIRADGSIDPPASPIQRDGDLYTLTDNITSDDNGIVIERDNMTLDGAGHTIQGFGTSDGIYLYGRSNVTIKNLALEAFVTGIGLLNSSGNTIVRNNITASNDIGIWLGDYCSNNSLIENRVTNSGNWGIMLAWAPYNTLSGNLLNCNTYSLAVFGRVLFYIPHLPFELSDYLQSIDASNLIDGKPIYYIVNQTNLIINPETYQQAGYLGLINCFNITVEGLTLTKNGQGLLLFNTNNSTVKHNIIADNFDGLPLIYSCNNTILENNVGNNDHGISVSLHSNSNNISDNVVAGNDGRTSGRGHGIHLVEASSNMLRRNNITDNQYSFEVSGNCLSEFINDIDVSNTVNNKSIYYLVNKKDKAVSPDAGYVALVNCTDIAVKNLSLYKGKQGMLVAYTTNCTITENNIADNFYGIAVCNSSNNRIYHNNFLNNINQVYDMSCNYPSVPFSINIWNYGYVSGGNYWSDYHGTDLLSGPYQDETGGDGIGDTPYIIAGSNQDNYPLMGSWTRAGENVSVTLPNDVTLVFANVNLGGITRINVTTFEPDRPLGFILAAEPHVYYDIETAADYSGNITVSVPYNDVNMTLEEENDLKLMHWDETLQSWVNVTTFVDVTNNIIYGQTSSLSPFAIMLQTIPGDVNGDYYVNAKDAVILGGAFYPAGTYETNADINDDGYCNAKDAIILGTYFGQRW